MPPMSASIFKSAMSPQAPAPPPPRIVAATTRERMYRFDAAMAAPVPTETAMRVPHVSWAVTDMSAPSKATPTIAVTRRASRFSSGGSRLGLAPLILVVSFRVGFVPWVFAAGPALLARDVALHIPRGREDRAEPHGDPEQEPEERHPGHAAH